MVRNSLYLFIAINLFVGGCQLEKAKDEWAISADDDVIHIKSGILEQELVLTDNALATSKLLVERNDIYRDSSGEINVKFWMASPNKEPQGIDYSSETGVQQTNAVKNQTDALTVKEIKNKTKQEVKWVDPVGITNGTFGDIFDKSSYLISEPKEGVKRLTFIVSSNKVLKGVSAEINYEIYKNYPVIRKWVKFNNQSKQWMKISDLLLDQLCLDNNYSFNIPLTPGARRGHDPSILVFCDSTLSSGIISVNETPSKLRVLSNDGTSGYNPDFFEWVLGPDESFESEPVFLYAFSGKSYPTISSVSTSLDRCIESEFKTFLNEQILRPVHKKNNIVPLFSTWTNYSGNINANNMHTAADVASRIGFNCFQLDAGWSDTGLNGTWGISSIEPDLKKFPDMKGLSNYIHSKDMKFGLWYSVIINEQQAGIHSDSPVLVSLPLIRRSGGLGLSFCYDKSRKKYVDDLVYLYKAYQVNYFKQDLSNIRYGDIARGHESRTLKESYLRGLRGLFTTQDEIHREAPNVWLQLTHEIYWGTPGPTADVAVLKHADSYHTPPNEYWGAGNRHELVSPDWKFNVDSLRQKLIEGTFRAREIMYEHRGLPLDRIEVQSAMTVNFNGSLTPEIQDRQVCSWLMGAPVSFSGDLSSLTEENIERYHDRFEILKNLQQKYGFYSCFQYSGVPKPTDENWHWWGKLNANGCGVVVVLRGSGGADTRKINIPWVSSNKQYSARALFSGNDLGVFSSEQLIKGDLELTLSTFGQEIIELKFIE